MHITSLLIPTLIATGLATSGLAAEGGKKQKFKATFTATIDGKQETQADVNCAKCKLTLSAASQHIWWPRTNYFFSFPSVASLFESRERRRHVQVMCQSNLYQWFYNHKQKERSRQDQVSFKLLYTPTFHFT